MRPQTALVLGAACTATLLLTPGSASASNVPDDLGNRTCQAIANGHLRSLQVCVAPFVAAANGDAVAASADITAYVADKKTGSLTQDGTIHVDAYGVDVLVDGGGTFPSNDFGGADGYYQAGSRGARSLSSGQTYSVAAVATFTWVDKNGHAQGPITVTTPAVAYTAP